MCGSFSKGYFCLRSFVLTASAGTGVPLAYICTPLAYICTPLAYICTPLAYICTPLAYTAPLSAHLVGVSLVEAVWVPLPCDQPGSGAGLLLSGQSSPSCSASAGQGDAAGGGRREEAHLPEAGSITCQTVPVPCAGRTLIRNPVPTELISAEVSCSRLEAGPLAGSRRVVTPCQRLTQTALIAGVAGRAEVRAVRGTA